MKQLKMPFSVVGSRVKRFCMKQNKSIGLSLSNLPLMFALESLWKN